MARAQPLGPSQLSIRKKIAFAAIAITLFFALAEGLLAICNFKPLQQERDPFVGFQGGAPLFARVENEFRTRPAKLGFFNKQSFPVNKSTRTFRIFVLGDSTAFGHPYDYRLAFPEWLKSRLQASDSSRVWEVVNCGGISYASYRLAILMEEIAQYRPDLVIIYTGHNEFLEERTYGEIRDRNAIYTVALKVSSHSRLCGLMHSAVSWLRPTATSKFEMASEVDTILEHSDGPETYHRDNKLRAEVLKHFDFSVRRMVSMAQGAGAKVILIQPASNLKDFTPFKSENSALSTTKLAEWNSLRSNAESLITAKHYPEALRILLEAEQIDPLHAKNLFDIGDMLFELGRRDEALTYFRRARDEDVCALRAIHSIHEIVEQIGTEMRVPVVDFPRWLEHKCQQSQNHRCVGLESFTDHVHPKPEVHDQLAQLIHEEIAGLGITSQPTNSPDLTQRLTEEAFRRISHADHARALNTLAMTLSWAGKNREALRIAEGASRLLSNDSEVISQYGRLLEKNGKLDEALKQFERALEINPNDSLNLCRLGDFYGRRGDYQRAIELLKRAIPLTPDQAPLGFRVDLHLRLGDALSSLGDFPQARQEYQTALKLDPTSEIAKQKLQGIEGAR